MQSCYLCGQISFPFADEPDTCAACKARTVDAVMESLVAEYEAFGLEGVLSEPEIRELTGLSKDEVFTGVHFACKQRLADLVVISESEIVYRVNELAGIAC